MRLIAACFLLLCVVLSRPVQADESMMFSELEFPNLEGETVSLQTFRGKVVLLNFWATWCPPCVKEMPSMQRLRDKLAGQPFEIVAIDVGESPDAVEAFMLQADTELAFPILLDERGFSFSALGIRGLPMSFLLNRDGKSMMTFMGGREWDTSSQLQLITEAINSGK